MRGPESTTRTTYTETLGREEVSTDLTRVGVQVSVLRRNVMRAREKPRGGAGAKVLLRAGIGATQREAGLLSDRIGHPVRVGGLVRTGDPARTDDPAQPGDPGGVGEGEAQNGRFPL